MPKPRRNEFPNFANMGKGINDLIRALPRVAGVTAVNFFKDSFNRKGFIDSSFVHWQTRKSDGRGSLMLQTGDLKRSIKKDIGSTYVEVSSDTPYSKLHNEGGLVTINITKKSRKFFWYMFHKTEDEMWKYLALTKKQTISFQMPKRQFMGESQLLMKRIEMNFNKELQAIIDRDMPPA